MINWEKIVSILRWDFFKNCARRELPGPNLRNGLSMMHCIPNRSNFGFPVALGISRGLECERSLLPNTSSSGSKK